MTIMETGGCSICGKGGRRLYRGLCPKHYMRWWKHGDANFVKQVQMHGCTVAERFWAKVDKSLPDGCWEWTAFRQPSGYGTFQLHGRKCLAHRLAYELEHGPIPEGLEIDHLCKNRSCVRPSHLEAVTREENMRRTPSWGAFTNKAKTHCPRGHAYDEDNTVHLKNGGRTCLACKRERGRKYEHNHRLRSLGATVGA